MIQQELLTYVSETKTIDHFSLKKLIVDMERERLGSSLTITRALQQLSKIRENDNNYQQSILAIAARHNLCQAIPMKIQLSKITSQNLVPDFLLYLALTENNGLVEFCKKQVIKHRKMYYYLQYMLPHESNYKKDKYILQESIMQKQFEKNLNEEYLKEYEVGLYHCDFYLPKSNTIIEVNGYKHYIHFKERKTGNYQQKYNYLIKKGYNVKEIDNNNQHI
ncbi:unnamed protein product [Paramecium primaurelia]|uniref:RAP domain-containing protein n=1 Tax=Paramecium primaurelia TaxID=5886 RepID=A0A8S1M266_PARPR|nr:unnamed protein product [Paramecium primaurelia]